jgi:hypothetical protein
MKVKIYRTISDMFYAIARTAFHYAMRMADKADDAAWNNMSPEEQECIEALTDEAYANIMAAVEYPTAPHLPS